MNADDMFWIWITGCTVALALFAIKVGLGLAAKIYAPTIPAASRWRLPVMAVMAYAILFAAIPLIHLLIPQAMWSDVLLKASTLGVYAHVAVSMGLIGWGVFLLSSPLQKRAHCDGLHGGHWLLILPCPVCALVILAAGLTGAQLLSIPAWKTALCLCGIFIMLSAATVLCLLPMRKKIASGSGNFLGIAMAAAGIFILCLLAFSPLYKDATDIFHLAMQNNPAGSEGDHSGGPIIAGGALLLLFIGACRLWRQERKAHTCKV